MVGAVAAQQGVVAVAAGDVEDGEGGEVAGGREGVLAAGQVGRELVHAGQAQWHRCGAAEDHDVGAVGVGGHVVRAGRAGHGDRVGGAGAGDADLVAGRAVEHPDLGAQPVDQPGRPVLPDHDAGRHRDGVGGAVVGAVEGGEVGVDLGEAGAGEVVDGQGVGAAEGAQVEGLQGGQVEGDRGDVAGQLDVVAGGGQVEVLADVGAVEGQPVGVGAAGDGVAGVAGVPGHRVGAGAGVDGVRGLVAVQVVLAGPAGQGLGSVAPQQGVVAVAAPEGGHLGVGERAVGLVDDDVVATGPAIDDDRLEALAVEGEVGGAVGTEVDLELGGIAGPEPEADGVGRRGAGDGEHTLLDGRRDPGRIRLVRLGREGDRGEPTQEGCAAAPPPGVS